MRKIVLNLLILLSLVLVAFTFANYQSWKIDPGFSIRFKDHFATGYFSEFSGDIRFDTADLSSAYFNVSVSVKSVNTGNKLKNQHARGEHWFDATKFPQIRFTSDSVRKRDSAYLLDGKLQIRDIEQRLTIPFHFLAVGDSANFNATFRINRASFHVGKPKGDRRDSTDITISVPVHSEAQLSTSFKGAR